MHHLNKRNPRSSLSVCMVSNLPTISAPKMQPSTCHLMSCKGIIANSQQCNAKSICRVSCRILIPIPTTSQPQPQGIPLLQADVHLLNPLGRVLLSPCLSELSSFSSGNASRYRRTLPASLASSSQWNRGRLELGGRMQSGTNLRKKPRTPLDAASMAAYSNRRVESEVQY